MLSLFGKLEPRRLNWLSAAVLCAAVAAVFFGVRDAAFLLWDDDINILNNTHLRSLSPENLRWMFTDVEYVRRYIPLTWLGWAVNEALFGLTPRSFHLGNVVLHCLSTVLVFFLVRKLLLLAAPRNLHLEDRGGVTICCVLAALIWAVHPLRVEAVAWASGRIYCQAMLFLLVAAVAYLQAVTVPRGTGRRQVFYWLAVGAFVLSMLTYPLGLGFVFVLVVLDFHPLRALRFERSGLWDGNARRAWLEKVPFALVVFGVFAVTWWARSHAGAFWGPSIGLKEFGVLPRVMQAFYIWAYYVWRPLVPFDLSPLYVGLMEFNPRSAPFTLSLMLVIGLTGLLVWRRRQWPGALALWICYLILLVPMLGLTEHPHFANDRYSYIVHILLSVVVAAGLLRWWQQPVSRTKVIGVGAGVAAILGLLSVAQVRFWNDSESLFRHMIATLRQSPHRADPLMRLGNHFADQKKPEEAAACYQEAIRIVPTFAEPHYLLGELRFGQGRKQEALAYYERAIRLRPAFPRAFGLLGDALAAQGKHREAIAYYRGALRLETNWFEPFNGLASILATSPDAPLRNGVEAVQLAQQACQLTGRTQAVCVATLAAAYAEAGHFSEAITAAENACALASAAGEKARAELFRRQLELHRGHQPLRTEPKP